MYLLSAASASTPSGTTEISNDNIKIFLITFNIALPLVCFCIILFEEIELGRVWFLNFLVGRSRDVLSSKFVAQEECFFSKSTTDRLSSIMLTTGNHQDHNNTKTQQDLSIVIITVDIKRSLQRPAVRKTFPGTYYIVVRLINLCVRRKHRWSRWWMLFVTRIIWPHIAPSRVPRTHFELHTFMTIILLRLYSKN